MGFYQGKEINSLKICLILQVKFGNNSLVPEDIVTNS